MTIWQIILIICGAITAIAFIIALIGLLLDDKKFKDREWWMLLAMLIIIPIVIIGGLMELLEYLSEVWKDGGFRKHYQLKRERKAEYEAEQKRKQEEKVEYNIKRTAYLNGLLTRDELPKLDGVHEFEFEDVTNPLLNSINEKCARIRGTFISQFDEELAQHYYIYGRRGEPKKIDLPRDLVKWE